MLSSGSNRCTLCGGHHRLTDCPWRDVAMAVGARLRPYARRVARWLVQRAMRAVCTVTSCKQVFRHNLSGRHDQVPHGVWECRRCGRVRLGRPIPQPTQETSP